MHFRLFFFLALPWATLGCDSFKNKTDHTAMECGIKKENVQERIYIKLLPADGQSYTGSDLKAIQTQFQYSYGDIQILPLTPRACVMVPNEAGVLQVVDSRNGESVTKIFEARSPARELLELNLFPKPEIQANLACPSDGLFAAEYLTQPLFLSVSSETAGLDIRLDLFSLENVFIKTVFRKAKGLSDLSLPSRIDVRDLHEGSYLLKTYGHHISQGIDSRPQLLASDQLCRLNILRGKVYVGGMERNAKPLVYPPRSLLPWTLQNSFEKLHVCHEKRFPPESGMAEASTTCKPQNTCADPANFKETLQISTEDSGVFDYFVFAENRAGIRSATECQTIIVSDAPPSVSVSWSHDDLKKPGSILRKPYAILKADIETQHDLIPSSDVGDKLTCKVDFEIKGKNFFSEKGVYCTEGRCKGKSLADFVPCDKQLAFTLVDALNQPMLLNSRLRLTVRASDGAGHTEEAQASLWINQSTWVKDVFPLSLGNSALDVSQYLIDSTSDVVATFTAQGQAQERLAKLSGGQWVELKADEYPVQAYKLARSRDGEIRIACAWAMASTLTFLDIKTHSLIP